MRSRLQSRRLLNALALGLLSKGLLTTGLLTIGAASAAFAEEPNANMSTTKQAADAEQIDRDGKRVCGWNIMTDSERGGYKNIMHQTKILADRDEIRVDHCARMRVRAKERGVSIEE
jgi:hypothetical protein